MVRAYHELMTPHVDTPGFPPLPQDMPGGDQASASGMPAAAGPAQRPSNTPRRQAERPRARRAGPPERAFYPAPVEHLIAQFAALPGIGRRSAERLALHVLKSDSGSVLALARAIEAVKQQIRPCSICFNLGDTDPCAICADPRRDRSTVLVVESPGDLIALEATGAWRGLYHVLMGHLSPMDGIGPEQLTVRELIRRVREPARNAGGTPVREVVLGLNPTLEGDGTGLYLAQQMRGCGVRVSRLARGLPAGGQLEYASKAVLADAIAGRQSMEA